MSHGTWKSEDLPEPGECEVGETFRLAKDLNIEVNRGAELGGGVKPRFTSVRPCLLRGIYGEFLERDR